jgi:LDH2 family malate/lactate/ureidoglycolate dehydrogenase
MRYNIDKIRQLSVKTLTDSNLKRDDAELVVDSMLEADINGVSTHGIRMLHAYVDKLKYGQFAIGHPQVVKDSPSFTVMDSNNIIGAISAVKASQICIEKAKEYGMHTVFAKNCNTFGPAFYYAEMMSKAGMIGFVCSNTPAAMPAFNGLEPMLGTNPLAFSCPSKTKGTITLDMATSIVAKSHFSTALANHEKLKEGWALDQNGNPTTDPMEAIKGFVLPMAGFKGYGIAMAIDILSGFLSGAGYLNKVNKFYSHDGKGMNVGQMFVAINPDMVYDGDFLTDMDCYITSLRGSKVMDGRVIAIPGDDRISKRSVSLKRGIELSDDTREKLESLFNTTIC